MRLSAFFLAAVLAQKGNRPDDGQPDQREKIKDLVARLGEFETWGKECAGKLNAKQNVEKKLATMNRYARKFYDGKMLEEKIDHSSALSATWDDVEDNRINFDNACECLIDIGRGYTFFFSHKFDGKIDKAAGKRRENIKKVWKALAGRLAKTYSCDTTYAFEKPAEAPVGPKPEEPQTSADNDDSDGNTGYTDDGDSDDSLNPVTQGELEAISDKPDNGEDPRPAVDLEQFMGEVDPDPFHDIVHYPRQMLEKMAEAGVDIDGLPEAILYAGQDRKDAEKDRALNKPSQWHQKWDAPAPNSNKIAVPYGAGFKILSNSFARFERANHSDRM